MRRRDPLPPAQARPRPAQASKNARRGVRTGRARGRRGFTLIDLAVTIGAVGVLGAGAFVGMSGVRAAARSDLCMMQLAWIASGNGQYALSNQDRMIGFTWTTGMPNPFPDLARTPPINTPVAAHAAQAIAALRQMGRPDITYTDPFFADVQYTPLILKQFEGVSLSDPRDICPSHEMLQKWRQRPVPFDRGAFHAFQPPPSEATKRYPYMSSYTPTAGAFDRNQTRFGIVAVANRVSQGSTHTQYSVPGNPLLGPSLMAQVTQPSGKVFMFDSHQRHAEGVQLYYCYPESQQPMLFFDGSVSVRMSGLAIPPWRPTAPTNSSPTQFQYTPAQWEPPLASGTWGSELVTERFRFTRNGLQGRDY